MAGSDSSLAVIPSGSGNDFVKSIMNYSVDKISPEKDITKGPSKNTLLERLINGNETMVDVGKINERYFINISSLGLMQKLFISRIR